LTGFFFEIHSNTKFYKNPSSGGRVVPRGRTDRQPNTKKLIVTFHNFAKAPDANIHLKGF